ncbi:hypothetical protein B5180_30195 [Streptomyces sp. BF-3]|nr:hypothetical protein B5180_30195 [Streptomyces sp. BF-3]
MPRTVRVTPAPARGPVPPAPVTGVRPRPHTGAPGLRSPALDPRPPKPSRRRRRPRRCRCG